jgi:hypothetical protein
MPEGIVRVPRSPTYADIKQVIHALEGEPAKRVRDIMNAIFDAAGPPHGPVDWIPTAGSMTGSPESFGPWRARSEMAAARRSIRATFTATTASSLA